MVKMGGRNYSKKEFEEMQKAGEKAVRMANSGKSEEEGQLRSAANDGGKTRKQVEDTKRKVRRGIGKD